MTRALAGPRTGHGDVGIETVGLTRVFGTSRAVDEVDLQVRRGEIYGFLGRNGAGKSTTVNLLSTLLRPTSGRALVAGFDVVREQKLARQAIGVAMQDVALDPVLTAWDHIHLQGALHGLSRRQRTARGAELLADLGLTAMADQKVARCSGGVKRRLDLVLALIHQPQVLFLDEPTNGLDLTSREALWQKLRDLASGGTTIFLTTQYLEEIDVLADRLGIIDAGRIVAEATPAELKARVGRPTVECLPRRSSDQALTASLLAGFGPSAVPVRPGAVAVRVHDTAALVDIVRVLDGHDVEVGHIEVRAPSLNDVFLSITGDADDAAASGVQLVNP